MRIERVILLIITILSTYFCSFAQPPAGYYDSAVGLSGSGLKSAVHDIIDDHTVVSYNGLWTAFRKTDVKEDGKVWDMYSDCDFTFGTDQCGNYSKICDCYNREHSFPKSWFDDATPMYSDLFHLYPTDGKVNGYRSNYPFGECAGGTVYGNGRLGSCTYSGYTGTVFEPADEYKGDFARTYFYMLTRYMDVCKSWSTPMMSNGNFSNWALKMLLEWNEEDPVSPKEIDRNNVIYSDFQHNRNPFIDYPELADKIFGNDNTPFNIADSWFENFEMGTKDSYINSNILLSTGEWVFNGVAIGTTDSDKKFDAKCAKFRLNGNSNGSTGGNGYIEMITPKMNGAGTISLYHASFGVVPVDNNSTWRLQISQNGGDFEDFGNEQSSSPELKQVVFEPMMGGNIRIRIKKTDGTPSRLNIDNIKITDYEGSSPFISTDKEHIDFGNVLTDDSNEVDLVVSGVSLSSNIGFELRGADANYFDVVKSVGWNNLTGGTLFVTFSPSEVRDYVGEILIKSAGADDVTVDLFGRGYKATVPTIATNITGGVVSFETTVNVETVKTIGIKGYNLTGDIELSTVGNSAFSVTPSRISKDQAMADYVNVMLKYLPQETGSQSGVLKIDSQGASQLTVDLTGQSNAKPDNMVLNGGFEMWEDNKKPEHWTVSSGAVTMESVVVSEGQHAASLDYMASNGTYYISPSLPISVVEGTIYNISFDYYFGAENEGSGGRIWGVWKDKDNKELAENNLKPSSYLDKSEKEVWKRFEIEATAPAKAEKLDLQIRWYAKARLYVDNVSMTVADETDVPFVEINSEEYSSIVERSKNIFVGIIGRNLLPNSDLTFSISGDYFTLIDKSLTADVDGHVDDFIMVKYSPQTIGVHNATLSITGGGITSPVVGTITGNAIKPTAPIAIEATNTTDSSFTANWSSGEVDNYLITVQDDANVLIADHLVEGANHYEINSLKPQKAYYYYVKATTGNFSSNRSNIITVITKPMSVNDLDESSLVAYYKNGMLFVEISDRDMTGEIQLWDISGRMVMKEHISNGKFNKELTLPDNIYILKVWSGKEFFTSKLIIK